jgi:hypothetical protein
MKRIAPVLALALVAGGCTKNTGSHPTPAPDTPTEPGNATSSSEDPVPLGNTEPIDPGTVAMGTTSEAGLITQIKPLVYNLHGADGFQVAVHWQHEDGPIPQGQTRRNVDRVATVASLTIHLTMPDGSRHDLQADTKDHTGQQRYNYGLYFAPTMLLTIGPHGLHELTNIGGPWKGTALTWTSGTYDVAVSGTIVLEEGGGIDFASEAVTIVTGVEGVLPNVDLYVAANEILEKHVPGVQVASGYGYNATESGFVSELVLEITKGERVVRFAEANPVWSYQLHTVTLDPQGNEIGFETKSIKTCVAEGTAIATPDGSLSVEALEVGDTVWSWDIAAHRRVASRVQEIRTGLRDDTIWLSDGLRITPDHPVYAGGAWVPAADVRAGATMIADDGQAFQASTWSSASGVVRVFDITVDGPHNFFAGGVLVHNKDRGYWPKLDDPWFFMWDPNYR